MVDIRQEVRDGAAALDEIHPGWEAVIRRGMLNMNFTDTCILGQLDHYERHVLPGTFAAFRGQFGFWLERHGKDDQWAVDHGFLHFDEQLGREWIALLRERDDAK